MNWQRPDPATVLKAFDLYLKHAFPGGVAPAAVNKRIETLKASKPALFESATWERDAPTDTTRYSLRLGNATYPHMKLVIERSPDGEKYLLRADTHDKHISVPAGSPEHAAFAQLMKRNQEIAAAIEAEWTAAGLPTFKQYLRKDLERRAAAAQGAQ